jgi:hypothetical protein
LKGSKSPERIQQGSEDQKRSSLAPSLYKSPSSPADKHHKQKFEELAAEFINRSQLLLPSQINLQFSIEAFAL